MLKPARLSNKTIDLAFITDKLDWRKLGWVVHPLIAFVITRFVVFLGAYLAEIALPSPPNNEFWHIAPENLFLDIWARFDSGFYLSIINDGYWFQPGQMSNVAFFPLYPLLVNFTALVTGDSLLAGILVSNLALLGSLLFLYRLTELEFGDQATAQRAVYYISAFPTALFFSAIYTESLFLFCSVGTVYFARRRLWGWATLMGLLTSATRIVGILMWGVVMLEWMRAHGWTLSTMHRAESWRNLWNAIRTDGFNILLIGLIPVGMLSYMLFLQSRFQDPVAFWSVQAAWGRTENVGPLVVLWRDLTGLMEQNFATGDIWWHVILDVPTFLAVLGLSVVMWRRLGEGYAIYSVLSVLIPASSATQSMTRYAVVLFPVFMILAWWGRYSTLDKIITISFSVFLGIYTAIFVNWVFIA